MSATYWLWLALALTVFWAVGAYNRLTRLRAGGVDALASVEKQLMQQVTIVKAHLSAMDDEQARSADEATCTARGCQRWQKLLLALERRDAALRAAKLGILSVAAMHELTLRQQAVQSAWDALAHAPIDVPQPNLTPELLSAWADLDTKVDLARSDLNQIVDLYNESASQFPASLLVASLGLGAAGLL
jgi:LemA protein